MHQSASELSFTSDDKDVELNRQLAFGINLNKISPVVRTNAEKLEIHFSYQHSSTYVDGPKMKDMHSLAVNYALD